ncbi:MAG TPA: dienelactone hydrolase family protein, partial [Methylomirabilota bacterium]
MSERSSGLTRRDVIKAGGAATFAGYAVGVEKALAQVIKTDTNGIAAGDFEVAIGSYNMPVYEARPASGGPAPIVVCVSEVWGVHEWVRDVTRRFAKAGYY